MPKLLLTASAHYPKIGDSAREQKHRTAYLKLERQEITRQEFQALEEELEREILREQIDLGVDLPTTGQIQWADPISHLLGKIEGVSVTGLLRYFDTNFYFRQPVIEKPICPSRSLIQDEFRLAQSVSSRPVKAVLIGPVTLAAHAVNKAYRTPQDLLRALTVVLAGEVEALVGEGVSVIQFDDPSLVQPSQGVFSWEEVRTVYQELSARRGKKAQIWLHPYWGNAASVYEKLQALSVDTLVLDFPYSPGLIEVVEKKGSQKSLALGLIDARNTRLESQADLFPLLDRVLPKLHQGEVYLSPSGPLETLSRDQVRRKLRNARRLIQEYTEDHYKI